MIKADDVLLFVQVVENGSFSKVAELMHLTNSVVSKRVARLEQSLNVQLLYRTTRKLSLTDAGRLLYSKGKLAKTAMQDATNVVNGYSDEIRGTIKLTMPVVSANLLLSKSVAEFCKKYPDVNVDLQVNNHLVDLIDEGYDLAIRTAYLEDSSLIARRLVDSQWVVCASPEYLRNNGTPAHPNDLHEHQCLIYKYESAGIDNWKFAENGKEQQIQVRGRFNTNNLHALCDAALSGLGISFLPQAVVYEHIEILNDYVSKMMGIYAVYPSCRQPDQKVKLLIEHLRDAFQTQENYFH
jgi:DNA-binding transcriptional LysR family regulator